MTEIKKVLLTKNDCYKAGRKITPKGIMVHSTGANNPRISRYVQPDDGIIGKNSNANDWNRSGIEKAVHAFIGKDKNGTVRIYQTLPWNYRGWHAGGKANDTHISFEICEDGLNDKTYFDAVYNAAVDLCVMLCKEYKLDEKDIICHCEGYKKGVASNHADVMHWFPKHGKSMDTLRADVKKKLNAKSSAVAKPKVKNPSIAYEAHVQGIGWQGKKKDGQTAGTTGKSKRLEALTVKLENTTAELEMEGHVQKIGWTNLRTDGEVIGTIGESLRLEAVKIKAKGLNIQYRVHVEKDGWTAWKKNGAVAGTTGQSKRIEAIQIKIA